MTKKNKNKDEAYNLRQIYEQMELDLITSMKRNLKRHQVEEEKMGFKFEQWQSAKLRDLKRFQIENKKIIDKYDPIVRKTIKTVLKETYVKAQQKALGFIKKIITKIFSKNEDAYIDFPDDIEPIAKELWGIAERPVEEIFFKSNDDKFKALMESVEGDFKKANATVLRRLDDIYRQTIFKTQVHLGQGVITLDKAIDMATKDFLEKGIDSIVYKDGKRVNIASYAEMALRTANHRSYLMGEGKVRQELGISFVVVSAHATSCKLCLPWQGKILIDDVYSGGKKEDGNYPLLSKAMKEGFLHPNCRHNLNTYMEGDSLPQVPDEEKALENYKAEQKQRELERRIRQQKRKIAGTVDKDNLKIEKKKLNKLQQEMRNHLIENPQLRRANRREKNYYTDNKKDDSIFINKLKEHEKLIVNEKVENAYVILENGDVHKFVGNAYSVDPTSLAEKLKGSFMTHNHPLDETYYSFSAADVSLFLEKEVKVLRGVDHKYSYQITRLEDTIIEKADIARHEFNNALMKEVMQKAMDGEIDMDIDGYHEAVEILARKYKFKYERYENE